MTPNVLSGPLNLRKGVLGVLIAALCFALVFIGARPTLADNNPNIVVNNATLVKTDATGSGAVDDQLYEWNVAKLAFDWNASNVAPITSGMSFSIILPDAFDIREIGRQDAMVVPAPNGVSHNVGTCVSEQKQMVCTFNETAAQLYDSGFRAFQGNATVLLTAIAATTTSTVPFNLNGVVTQVRLPGGQPIRPEPYVGWEFEKWAEQLTQGARTGQWSIVWGTDYLAHSIPSGTFIADGHTRSTLTIKDALGPGQTYDASRPWDATLILGKSAASPAQWIVLRGINNVYNSPGENWSLQMTPSADGTNVDIIITGAFPPSTNMVVRVPVKFDTPVRPGIIYSNTASVVGIDQQITRTTFYTEAVTITVRMERGFGTFNVAKLVDGNGASLLQDGTTFDLGVVFTLPQHFTQFTPQWTPPAGFAMDTDGVTGRGVMKISPGKTAYFDPIVTLPVGTRVAVTEDPTTVSPAPSGTVQWGTPEIDKVNFTIGDQQVTTVNIKNTATKVAAVSIGDYVWEDVNDDGVQDASDRPIKDVTLTVSRSDGNTVNNADGTPRQDTTETTNDQGNYLFSGLQILPQGVDYVVTVTPPAGMRPAKETAGADTATDSSAVAGHATASPLLTDGAQDLTLDFGYVRHAPSIQVEKYSDALATGDADTADDAVELKVDESKTVTFEVTNNGNEDLRELTFRDDTGDGPSLTNLRCTLGSTVVTAANGVVTFDPNTVLPVGQSYTCTATLPGMPANKSHADQATVTGKGVGSGTVVTDDDPWHSRTPGSVTVGDYVWEDVNRDGIQDGTDRPIEGVVLTLTNSAGAQVTDVRGNLVGPATTDATGRYLFENLPTFGPDDHYKVTVTAPAGFVATQDGQGTTATDSSAQAGFATTTGLVTHGEKDLTLDFGYVRAQVAVGDYVWEDVNDDGLQDATDRPIKDVTLTISRTDGATVKNADGTNATTTTTTGTDGKYLFAGLEVLPAGTHYVVTVTAPAGFIPAKENAGADAAKDSSAQAGRAESKDLIANGDEDLTLDFGYIKAAPSILVEKYSDTLAVGDADTADAAVQLKVEESKTVTFDVTNNGNESLKELTFSDATTTGPTLADLKCTLKGNEVTATNGVVTFDAATVLAVGESYTCTATLQGMAANTVHADTVTVGGKGVASGKPVTDDDPWHAKTPGSVTVGDYVWEDLDRDGVQDDGEPGIKGVTLRIVGPGGQPVTDVKGNAVGPVSTDDDGKYVFAHLPILGAGESYTVSVVAPQGFIPTTDTQGGDTAKDSSAEAGTVASTGLNQHGDEDLTLDFGYVRPRVSVGDYVWEDRDRDGVQDDDEPGIKGVTLTIVGPNDQEVRDIAGQLVGPTTTDANGKYTFANLPVLPAGQHYTVNVTAPEGFIATTDAQGGDTAKDSSAQAGKAESTDLTTDGGEDPTLDFGYIRPKVKVGDYVWEDTNKNGRQDPGEPGIKDVTLSITDVDGNLIKDVDGNPVNPVKTDGNGYYEFPNLVPGKYKVTVTPPAGYDATTPKQGDAAGDSSSGFEVSRDLTNDGDEDLTLDFGYVKKAPSKVAKTGTDGVTIAGFGIVLLLAGGATIAIRRRLSA
ncbi:SdrD B-like domain-containing protein [Schaalia suimastitidis]|uniref:SdrD B-like domain-containing protein n=1 Tax=Schaalia suimastitidis TaxID=121163 RepID=UPI000409575F|nr:SdrD B-like domain-containing protein [Schaalia suimastitidis]